MARDRPRPLVLLILDGWGLSDRRDGNAIYQAKTTTLDSLWQRFPHTILDACGDSVGLPPGQMGNSEAGHLNIGAGRIIYQDLSRITRAIEDESFYENESLLWACRHAKRTNRPLHLMGLVSDGGVHSHIDHISALLKMAHDQGLEQVMVHAFLDGRDTAPQSAIGYLRSLEKELQDRKGFQIATVMGRYFSMDRDQRWDRTKLAYECLVYGRGLIADDAEGAVSFSYDQGMTDEFVRPAVLRDALAGRDPQNRLISDDDSVIFFNFRADRARQISKAFVLDDFGGFDRGPERPRVRLVTFTQYEDELEAHVAFRNVAPRNVLGDVLAAAGLKQLRLAETEKYAHVTFFFNGGVEEPKEGEARRLIPSPKVATYDLNPEMSAAQVTEQALKEIVSGDFDVLIINYANLDMVGHTGVIEAAIRAVETVDRGAGRLMDAIVAQGGECLVTADHGDAEQMTYPSGKPHTAHTCNPVPLIYVTKKRLGLHPKGILADIAPTMLDILQLEIPPEMTGRSLIERPEH